MKINKLKNLFLLVICLLNSCSNFGTFKVGYGSSGKRMFSPSMFLSYEAPKKITNKKVNNVTIYFAHLGYFNNIGNTLVFNKENDYNFTTDPWNLFGFQVNLDDKVLYSEKIENFRETGQMIVDKRNNYIFPIKTTWKIDLDLIELENSSTKEIIIRIVSVDDYETLNDKPELLWKDAEMFGAQSLFIHKNKSNYELSWSDKWDSSSTGIVSVEYL
jgi:hypothetical protein